MDPMSDKKIDELLALEKDNNRMLHKMRRSMVWSQIFSFLYWAAIIGLTGWSYYLLQPYLQKYWAVYQSAMETLNKTVQTVDKIEKAGSSLPSDLTNLLEKTR